MQRFDVRLAYRLFDVKTTYGGVLLQKPLTAQNRAFANLAYEIKGWKFDYTLVITAVKDYLQLQNNPCNINGLDYSPSFVVMNAQVTKSFGKKIHLIFILARENLTNYYQKNAIIAADDPFGEYFDASMIWGP